MRNLCERVHHLSLSDTYQRVWHPGSRMRNPRCETPPPSRSDARDQGCEKIRRTTMERRQTWIATAAVMVTVILSAIGATGVIGRNTATPEDVTQLRNEVSQLRK